MTSSIEIEGVCRLDDWGLIRASGADAASFLHSQLTSDVVNLGADEVRLAGYCSPKGRLLASFVLWRDAGGDILLACSADLLSATLKRLRMFVLRAKCVLSDASAELPLYGLVGTRAVEWLGDAAPPAPWTWRGRDGLTAIALPTVEGRARVLCAATQAPDLPACAQPLWRWLEVRSGIARIEAATAERFVPQMINYELLGGVDFRKGCYPGQEVVARSQYRGSVKRRAMLFELDAPAAAGQEVFERGDPGQPAGAIVNAAAQPAGVGGAWAALVEARLVALDGELRLGSGDGPALRPIDLPYPLPLGAELAQ